jgi:hypothetical protein
MKRFWDFYITPGDLQDAGSAFLSKSGKLIGLNKLYGTKWYVNSENNRSILSRFGRHI